MVLLHMVVVNAEEKSQEFCQARHDFSISQTWTTSSADDLKKKKKEVKTLLSGRSDCEK